MQVSVEINDLECRMTVGVPRARVDEEVQKRLKDLARKSRINGFRPGKVPVRVIQQRYGSQVRQEVLGDITQESFQNAVTQENLRPAGMPSIEFNEDDKTDDNISFTAAFEIYPQVANITLDGINIEKIASEVADSDIDEMIEKLRDQRKTWESVERPAQEGDQVLMDFEGFLQGTDTPFEGGTSTDYVLELGSKRFIAGFEAGLVGATTGQSLELDLTFPEDYQNEELAGQAVLFKVQVKDIKEMRLPEVDDTFIQAFGVEEGEIEAFRTDIRENLERELSETLKSRLKQQVLDKLLEANDIKVPTALVQTDAQQLKENMETEFANQGIDPAQLALTAEQFTDRASKRVQLGILIAEVVQQNELQPQAEKIREMVENIAGTYEEPETVVSWFYSDPAHLKEIEASVLEDEVVDWVLDKVSVTDVQQPFSAVMNPANEDEAER